MSGNRQRTNPTDDALARLAELAGRGVEPGRMVREVALILSRWRSADTPVGPAELSERLIALYEALRAGAEAAAEQAADIDRGDGAALRHAERVGAALAAAVRAVAAEIEPQPVARRDVAPAPDARAATPAPESVAPAAGASGPAAPGGVGAPAARDAVAATGRRGSRGASKDHRRVLPLLESSRVS